MTARATLRSEPRAAPGARGPRVPGAPRAGIALVELLVGATLAIVVLGATVGALAHALRAEARLRTRREARAQLAHAAAVLAAELRAVTGDPTGPESGDVLLVADSAVEIRALVGASMACALAAGGSSLELIDASAPEVEGLTTWPARPRAGDQLLALDEGPSATSTDDRWRAAAVQDAAESAAACRGGPAAPLSGTGAHWRITLAAPLPATLAPGAPVRVVRRRRYALYRAGDGHWYLGQREWEVGGSALQPVAGPLLRYQALGASGLSVAAFDSAGAPVVGAPAGRAVARVSVTLRVGGVHRGRTWTDSAVVQVAPRGGGG